MKKCSFIALLFAVTVFVGQAWAAEMCLWNAGGDCWPLSAADRNSCKANGWIFDGGEEGVGTMCAGGTFTGEGKTDTPPTSVATSLGCCKWDTETKCYDVYTESDVTDCSGGDNKFYSGACPDKDGTCPSGGGGSSSSRGGGTSSSSRGSSGGGGHCTNSSNDKLYCGYEGSKAGCYKIQNEYSDDGDACSSNPNAKGCAPCADKIADCEKDGAMFTGVDETPLNAAPWGDGENCRDLGGDQVGGKEDCGNNYCKWESGCEKISPDPDGDYGPASANCNEAIANCEADGELFNSQSACQNATTPSSSSRAAQSSSSSQQSSSSSRQQSSSSQQQQSIRQISLAATSNIVKAIHNGVNVQLMDGAKIQVYDLKGNMVRSLELAKGSYNVELSNMPRGTYIVRVTGRSWKQTVTVPVK